MKVVLGSKNFPKQRAVARAFTEIYPEESIGFQGVAAESEVSSHPTTAEESIRGAFNRIKNARKAVPNADFWIGIEGGLLHANGRYYEHSWVAIEDKEGQRNTAISAGLELRGKLLAAILKGQELSDAVAEQHGVENAGNRDGLYGMATDDIVTRADATVQAVPGQMQPCKPWHSHWHHSNTLNISNRFFDTFVLLDSSARTHIRGVREAE